MIFVFNYLYKNLKLHFFTRFSIRLAVLLIPEVVGSSLVNFEVVILGKIAYFTCIGRLSIIAMWKSLIAWVAADAS
jgi:hypothetical protein